MQITRNRLETTPGPSDWFTMQQADEQGNVVDRGEHVSDGHYGKAQSLEEGGR